MVHSVNSREYFEKTYDSLLLEAQWQLFKYFLVKHIFHGITLAIILI